MGRAAADRRCDAWLCLAVDEPESDAVCLVREYLAGFMLRFLAEALPSFRPREVLFPHAPRGSLAEYERLLGAPVRFRQRECAIGIAPHLLAAPIPTANTVVARVLGEQIDRRRTARSAGELRASVERLRCASAAQTRTRSGRHGSAGPGRHQASSEE